MNRADLELLQRSMGDLGQSFLQNRQLSQAAKERELDRQMKEQMMAEQVAQRHDATDARRQYYGAQQQHFQAEQQHYQNMEDAAKGSAQDKQQMLQQRAKEHANRSWDGSIKWFGQQVKDGLMTSQNALAGVTQAYQNMPDQAKQMLEDNPSVLAIQSGSLNWQDPPTKQERAPAAVATLKAIQDMEGQADDIEDDNPDQADYLRQNALLLRQNLQRKPAPGLRKTVTTGDMLGNKQTLSGPAPDVDAALKPQAPPGSPAVGGQATLKFVRDPKSNKLVPAPNLPTALPQ